jgi:hypothetical protein
LKEALRIKAMNDNSENDTLMVETVDSAIRQAAEKVLERAKQTHTLVVIWEDDQIKEVPPEEMEIRLNARLSLEPRA